MDAVNAATGAMLRGMMRFVRWIGPERAEAIALPLFRVLSPLVKENRTAADNIAAAFPEKDESERAAILRGSWQNFAQTVVEFVFLDRLAAGFDVTRPGEGKIIVDGIDRFVALRDDDRPAVIFAAHLANWEVLAVVAAKYGLKMVIPYRRPTNRMLAEDILSQRVPLMGQLVPNSRGAGFEMAAALDRNEHLGMLVDQRLPHGLVLPFFGRPAQTNPLAAKFARQFDCPVHGTRAIRQPDGHLYLELTPEIEMPRDADGLIDVKGATMRMNQVIEGWIREHPEQWFWQHDRWRL
jgi:Kdo2-lipid IVA lauroyltransferase/acyltransferase